MKITTLILSLILFIGCNSKKESINEENSYPKKNRFIVSENDKRLDSVINVPAKDGTIKILAENKLTENSTASIHFLIESSKRAYYIEKPDVRILCGTNNESDSIFAFEQNQIYLDSLIFLNSDSIPKFINSMKAKIIKNEDRNFPRTVSFALKNDTLQGSLMHDILELMEKNGMKSYFIRRMNEHELKAIKEFQK